MSQGSFPLRDPYLKLPFRWTLKFSNLYVFVQSNDVPCLLFPTPSSIPTSISSIYIILLTPK